MIRITEDVSDFEGNLLVTAGKKMTDKNPHMSFNDTNAKETSDKIGHDNKNVRFQSEAKPKHNVPIALHMAQWILRTNACLFRGKD